MYVLLLHYKLDLLPLLNTSLNASSQKGALSVNKKTKQEIIKISAFKQLPKLLHTNTVYPNINV